MGLERHPVLGQLPQRRQAEHLVAAGIGQDRVVPVHEGVQAAQVPDQLMARPQKQVIGITQDDGRTAFFEHLGGHALDSTLGAHRHENRGLHLPMGGAQHTPARGSFIVCCQMRKSVHLSPPSRGLHATTSDSFRSMLQGDSGDWADPSTGMKNGTHGQQEINHVGNVFSSEGPTQLKQAGWAGRNDHKRCLAGYGFPLQYPL